jgi:rod shape-determining protein MreD
MSVAPTTRRLHPGLLTALWLLPSVAVLQTAIAGWFTLHGVFPLLMVILIVDWGILRGPEEAVVWAFFGGLCLDFLSGWPFGTSTVALVLVASLVSLGEGTFMRTHTLVPLGTVFGATILYYAIALFILQSTKEPVDWLAALRAVILPGALYNCLLNIPAFKLVHVLERRVYPAPRAHW